MVTRTGVCSRWLAALGFVAAAVATACGGGEESGDGSGDSETGGSSTGGSAMGGGTGGSGVGGGGAAGTGTGGSGTGGSGGGMPTDPALADFCADVRAAQIGYLERCNGLDAATAAALASVDPCAVWGPAVENGRMQFDAAADSGACIAGLEAMACDADALPPACEGVLRGVRTASEVCSFAAEVTGFSECETGAACVGELLGSISCEGTCVARGNVNQPCSGAQPCLSGLTCTIDGVCALKGTSGATCGLSSSPECQAGLHCSDIVSGGSCVAYLPVGATCTGAVRDCEPPAVCERGLDITGTCAIPRKPGEACEVDEYQCSGGLGYCGASGTCRPLSRFGEPCENTDGEGTSCLVGTCDETAATPTCRPANPGESCLVHADCAAGSLCQTAFSGGGFVMQCTPTCY